MYGLTECKRCTYLPPEDIDRKPTSVGIAIPNTELWLVDEEGNQRSGPNAGRPAGDPRRDGDDGLLGEARGHGEEAQARARCPASMVLYTGDYCRLDDEGYLYFVGRMDDIIKSRGEKVAPKEVENVLMNIAGVNEAAVIGVPDDDPRPGGEGVRGARAGRRRCTDEGHAARVPEPARELHGAEVHRVRRPSCRRPTTGKIKKTDLK